MQGATHCGFHGAVFKPDIKLVWYLKGFTLWIQIFLCQNSFELAISWQQIFVERQVYLKYQKFSFFLLWKFQFNSMRICVSTYLSIQFNQNRSTIKLISACPDRYPQGVQKVRDFFYHQPKRLSLKHTKRTINFSFTTLTWIEIGIETQPHNLKSHS